MLRGLRRAQESRGYQVGNAVSLTQIWEIAVTADTWSLLLQAMRSRGFRLGLQGLVAW
jgi:hypothetical protein